MTMICGRCGKNIQEGAAFCPYCGAVVGAKGPTNYAGLEAPASGGGGKKGLLIGGIAAAVVAIIAVIAVVASGVFSNPKGALERAAAKSLAAYAQAEKALNMPDTAQWRKDQSIFQSMSLQLREVNSQLIGYDLSALNGLELDMSAGYDGMDRYMYCHMAGMWGADELILLRLLADDDELYFQSPQFTGGTYYGVNTETLGADLADMSGDRSMEGLSFNLFDMVDMALERVDQEELEKDLRQAGKALWESVEVKKVGSRALNVNGAQTKTTAYQVAVPQEAMEDYVDALAEAMSAMDYYDIYEEMFQSMGMPQERVQAFLDGLEELDYYSRLADAIHGALDEFGDLELEVCLSGGYLSAVLYEGGFDGTGLELALYLGGNGAYVDDLSVELTVEDTEVTWKSSGDHGLKGGAYTDKTTLRVKQSGVSAVQAASELSYDPKGGDGNFQWKLGVDSSGLSVFGLDAQGALYVEEDLIDLTLEDAAVSVMGMEVCGLRFNCKASRCPDMEQPLEDARLLGQMDDLELAQAYMEVGANIQAWTADMERLFAERLPWALYSAMFY